MGKNSGNSKVDRALVKAVSEARSSKGEKESSPCPGKFIKDYQDEKYKVYNFD